MKIDFHVHVTPPEIIKDWKKYAKKDRYFSMLAENPHNKFMRAEDIVSDIVDSGFDHAVVFGFAFKDQGLCRFVNDYVIEMRIRYPNRLIGFISVSPNEKGAEQEIERCFAAGLTGVGELFPEGQGFNIENKKETRIIAGACIEHNIPLLLHVNEPVGHDYIGKNKISLKKIEKFVVNNPKLKIVLAHLGGGIIFYETMKEIKESFRNVYYDTAAAPFLYDSRVYDVVKALGLCEKILFGSDFPLLPPSRYMPDIEKSALSTEEKRLILGANAEKLLNY